MFEFNISQMNPSARKTYNANFTEEKYQNFLSDLNEGLKEPIAFRVAETPVFLTDDFRDKLITAGNDIIKTILQPNFKQLTERAIPEKWRVANETGHSHFIALDFGVCRDEDGELTPKLNFKRKVVLEKYKSYIEKIYS